MLHQKAESLLRLPEPFLLVAVLRGQSIDLLAVLPPLQLMETKR